MTHFTRWKTSPGRRRPTTDRGGRVCPERVEFMVFVWQIGEFGDTTRKWIKIDDCELCDLSKLSVRWPLYHGGVRSEITVKDTHSKLLSPVVRCFRWQKWIPEDKSVRCGYFEWNAESGVAVLSAWFYLDTPPTPSTCRRDTFTPRSATHLSIFAVHQMTDCGNSCNLWWVEVM